MPRLTELDELNESESFEFLTEREAKLLGAAVKHIIEARSLRMFGINKRWRFTHCTRKGAALTESF